MNTRILMVALAVFALLAVAACAGGTTQKASGVELAATNHTGGEFTDLGLDFPAPSELALRIVSLDDDWLKPGAAYEEELPHANVEIEDTSLRYRVVDETNPSEYHSAHAFYAFNIANQPVSTELKLIWHDYPGHLLCWVGLPILDTDEWDWIPLPANCTIPLDDCSKYMSSEMPLTVGVVLSGRENQLLDWIRLGDNAPPEADLTAAPDTGKSPLVVTLDASGSTDSDGNIVRYDWDFDGDGTTDSRSYTQAWTEHTYNTPGEYNATVTIYDDAGDSDSASAPVLIEEGTNEPPHAVLTADPCKGIPPLLVKFDASGSYDNDGGIIRYEWDFDGDLVVDESGPEPFTQHLYTGKGNYEARVTVVDGNGTKDFAWVVIEVLFWEHTWGGEHHDELFSVVQGEDTELYACGRIDYIGEANGLAIKYSSEGEFRWVREYICTIYECFKHTEIDSAGNIWLAGYIQTPGYSFRANDLVLVQISPDGELLQQFAWHTVYDDSPRGFLIDDEDCLYLFGESVRNGEEDICVVKLDNSGNLIWAKLIGSSNDEERVFSGLMSPDNQLLLCGRYKGESDEYKSGLLLKLDLDGNLTSCNKYQLADDHLSLVCLSLAPDNTYYISGATGGIVSPDILFESIILHIDQDWTPLWASIWDALGNTIGRQNATMDGEVIYMSIEPVGTQYLANNVMIAFNSDGTLLWARERALGYAYIAYKPGQPLFFTGQTRMGFGTRWQNISESRYEVIHPDVTRVNSSVEITELTGNLYTLEGEMVEPEGIQDGMGGYSDAVITTFY